MVQQGQIIELTRRSADGNRLWAYRYRPGGRDSKGIQRGFVSAEAAREALERELERMQRERRIARRLTLAELVETYLAQHDLQPVTIERLRYPLKPTAVCAGLSWGGRSWARTSDGHLVERALIVACDNNVTKAYSSPCSGWRFSTDAYQPAVPPFVFARYDRCGPHRSVRSLASTYAVVLSETTK